MISSLRNKFHQCGLEFVHNVRNFSFSGFKFKARNDTKSKQKRCKWKLSLVNYYVEINTVTKPFHSLFVLLWCIFIQTLKPFTVIVICMFRSGCNLHVHVYRWCTFTCTCTVQVHCIYLRFNIVCSTCGERLNISNVTFATAHSSKQGPWPDLLLHGHKQVEPYNLASI